MFHNAKILLEQESGPFFYLPKLEGYKEARLWNQVFDWAEEKVSVKKRKDCNLYNSPLHKLHTVL